MYRPSKEAIELLKKWYPKGTRVELRHMDDPFSTLRCGDRGTVRVVDDMGTVHVDWDCGSRLGLVYGEDSFDKVEDK